MHHNGWILCYAMDVNISRILGRILSSGIYPRNKDYVAAAVFSLPEDGFNALHSLLRSGGFVMLHFNSDWVCLLLLHSTLLLALVVFSGQYYFKT